MAKNKLKEVAVKIGGAMGKADKVAHETAKKAAHAGKVAKKELAEISKQIDAMKKQLEKSTKKLKKALS
jgi:hypothetical protein